MSDAPQRRRANAPQQTHSSGSAIKKYRVPIIIGAVWLAIVGYNVAIVQGVIESGADECPGHWHSTIDYFVEGERVRYPQPPYTISGEGGQLPLSSHMHSGDDRVWHWEPTTETCLEFRDAARRVDTTIESDRIAFDGAQTVTGEFMDNATHEWRVFHQEWDGEWEETSLSAVAGRQLLDGERVVFAYAAVGEDVSPLYENVGPVSQAPVEGADDPGPFIAIVMTTVFAGIAIAIWYNMASKTW